MEGRRATMRDVARASGVSPATVSFVMNDTPGQTISPETRTKVRRAAAELGYTAHPIARALREGASRIIVLDLGGLPRTPVLDGFIRGMDEELVAAGFGLFVTFAGAGHESTQAAVAAVNPRATVDLAGIYAHPEAGVPDGGWHDGMAAHYLAQVRYLHDRGHERIAIAVPSGTDPMYPLMADYIRSAASRLEMAEPTLLPVEGGSEGLRARIGDATAIAALTDAIAFEVLAALHDEGIAVPDEVAVIGWGDTAEAALWRPALTTIRIDARTYGRRTARQVLGLPVGDASPAPTQIIQRETA